MMQRFVRTSRIMRSARLLFGPLNGCRRYPWAAHILLLSPLLVAIAYISLRYGWWGEPVRQVYTTAREAYPTLTYVMTICSKAGSPLLYAAYAYILLRAFRHADRRPCGDRQFIARFGLFSVLITLCLTQALKTGFGMPRPSALWPPQPFSFFSTAYNSFPSGHTTEIVAAALPLALRFRRKDMAVFLSLLILLVGYSRVWLGYHHPVDVLGGVLVGSLAARLIYCRGNTRSRNAT